jgi:hypothetical protein
MRQICAQDSFELVNTLAAEPIFQNFSFSPVIYQKLPVKTGEK